LLKQRGYATGAFVASRVLDRRFGLARGFDVYDDNMSAEHIDEYGYPERDAVQMTNAALAWASRQSAKKPMFLWVHYYDPHSPYVVNYAHEVALVDREVGRLLGKLRNAKRIIPNAKRIVIVAADHGEALGEHGERTHGVFLYRSVLEVPLFIAEQGRGASSRTPSAPSASPRRSRIYTASSGRIATP
jgi:arylsulfatase A-like enzyme